MFADLPTGVFQGSGKRPLFLSAASRALVRLLRQRKDSPSLSEEEREGTWRVGESITRRTRLDEGLLGLLVEDVQVIGIENRLDRLTWLRL